MMKKNYLWMAAMASLLSFTACSDDASPLDNSQAPGEVVMDDGTTIEISVSNTGIGTRAARPMGSSAAANNVDKVQLVFFTSTDGQTWTEDDKVKVAAVDGNNNVTKGNIVSFSNKITEGVPGNTGRIEESHKIKLSGLEKEKHYRIVAYGYNNTFPYQAPAYPQAINGLMKIENLNGKSGYDLEEVFAGSVDAPTLKNTAKFSSSPKVTIERQVAGILAYFKVPTKVEGKIVHKVAVLANAESTGFVFPNKLRETKDGFNGLNTTAKTVPLITFDMKVAKNYKGIVEGTSEDNYYTVENSTGTGKQTAYNAKGLAVGYNAPQGLALENDAFFGARYIIPYASHQESQTLTVILYGKKENEAATEEATEELKTLKVKSNQGSDMYQYDILCNNFYSIGKKLASGNTGGDPDPNKPTNPDPDKPIDLGATDQIIVEINDAWDVLHDMDVEE